MRMRSALRARPSAMADLSPRSNASSAGCQSPPQASTPTSPGHDASSPVPRAAQTDDATHPPRPKKYPLEQARQKVNLTNLNEVAKRAGIRDNQAHQKRSEEHTSELQ